MGEETMEKTYHVVCRECSDEWLTHSGGDAQRLAEEHARETAHRVAFARIE